MQVVRTSAVSTEERDSVTKIASDSSGFFCHCFVFVLFYFTLKKGKLLEWLCVIVSLK